MTSSRSSFPIGWTGALLGEVATFEMGQAPPGSASNFSGQGTVFVKAGEFGKDFPLIREWTTVPLKYARAGDVLICVVGATAGKLNLGIDCAIGRSVAAIRPNGLALQMIIYRQLQARVASMRAGSTGSAQSVISKEMLAELPIAVPPRSEQQRIADKLDTVLARVDACRDGLARVVPLLKRFRQSVLAAATSGRLTEDWRVIQQPTRARAVSQLDNIAKERLRVMKRAKEPVERTKTEEFDIPASWIWTSLDALTAKIVDGTHHTPNYVERGIAFVSVKDVRDGLIDFSNTKFISKDEHLELSKRCPVARGDLLITKSGTIGRTAMVATDTPFSLFVSVALLKPASRDVNMRFIECALQNWVGSIDVSSRIVGSTIKNLHLVDMKVLGIPFPSFEEQSEIVRRVGALFAFADRLEARLAQAQTAVDRLTPSLLAKAFRGELVPQDPTDEPAAELLKRLAACRTAPTAKTRKPRQGQPA